MSNPPKAPKRDYEESLRSLGLIFDEGNLHDVMVVELSSGFGVTALKSGDVLATTPEERDRFIEAHFDDEEVAQAETMGTDRRGTRHRADRNEEAFRLLGRYINQTGGSHVLIVDQGDGFLVRTLVEADGDMPHRFVTISSGELENLRTLAKHARDRD